MKPRWQNYFKNIVIEVAKNSTCLRRKVGAVLVHNRRILATGYNGVPTGVEHCTTCPRDKPGIDLHKCVALHAEENALLDCAMRGVACAGAIMFCTCFPCNECLKKIIQCRIHEVYVLEYYPLDDEGEAIRTRLMNEGKVVVYLL